MRILYVAPRYHTNQIPIMEGWKEHGDDVLFLVQYTGQSEDYSVIRPVVLGYGPVYSAVERIYLLIKRKQENALDLRLKCGTPSMRKLCRLVRQFGPDVVITRERSVYSMAVTFLCRFFGYPVILYNQTPLWEDSVKDDPAHRLVRLLTPKYRITPVFSLGRGVEGKTKEKYAYYLPFLMKPHLAPQDRAYFAGERINLFAIGKYQKRKNHKMLVEVVAELYKYWPVHLVIAGEVSNSFHEAYYRELNALIGKLQLQDVVELKVNLKREEIFDIYKKTDLFVLASTGEPAAVSHLEAMSFSIPVVTGEDNGTACYVEEGVNGYIFRDNDREDLKEKLEEVLNDRERLKAMGAESYRLIMERHQFSVYYKKIMEILSRMKQEK